MRANLEQFRAKVMSGRLVREWTSREQLETLVLKSLMRATTDYPAVGWLRANTAASEDILSQLNDVRAENEKLREKLSSLSNEMEPKLDSLADFDEKIRVNYKYITHYRGSAETRKANYDLSWQEVVLAVGPSFMKPALRAQVSAALGTYLKEVKGKDDFGLSVFSTDVDIVTSQLLALSILKSYQADTVKGGISEFLTLTDLGKKKLLEFSAVRSAKPASS